MKQTISLTDNYRKRLKDEICLDPTSGLRGEVEIQIRNKETGEIESTQRKNLIVYGGREWLLKKAFASNTTTDGSLLETLRNSEILWFGVGSGGGEPGNPLQCGTTYGSDADLYNPVRLRYELDTEGQINPNYASRIVNGKAINGYYKKISYIGIKEDLANPYKVNGTILYPNLIAEIRLEISTDDICGQTYLETDFERSYADINEAALFIADSRLSDPGRSNLLTKSDVDFYTYNSDGSRYYFKEMNYLPPYNKVIKDDMESYEWTSSKPFNNNSIQYFDVYYKKLVSNPEDSNYQVDDKYYKLEKITNIPYIYGIYNNDDENNCTGSITLDKENKKLLFMFVRPNQSKYTFEIDYSNYEIPDLDYTLDNFEFLTHGTVFVKSKKCEKFIDKEKDIECTVKYRNGYMSDSLTLIPPHKNVFKTNNVYTYILPIHFIFDENGNIVECEKDKDFTNLSIIRVTQSTDTFIKITSNELTVDVNSTECRIYTEDISNITEGLKIFTSNLNKDDENYISEDNPATVVDVYNKNSDNINDKSYFIIDRKNGMVTQKGKDIEYKLYTTSVSNPYTMFNRVCFSTIRLSHSREILLLWRIYF